MPVDKDGYIWKRRKLTGVFFETALPNEYLIEVGRKAVEPILGGRQFRLFKKFLRVPGSVETLYFETNNANQDFQGIGVEGYASWRIDPDHPEIAISTLDFFDDNNPMQNTNEKLTTICIEAVRHVIANMSVSDALKKKDEIGDDLKEQLKKFEERWGILFDQVGIKKVRIMSEKLFEDLQSEYRDKLRLKVATARIDTDREIAGKENVTREQTQKDKMETDKKLMLITSENETTVTHDKQEKQQVIAEQARLIEEDQYRRTSEFQTEKQDKEYADQMQEQRLKAELQELESSVLNAERELESIRGDIAERKLDLIKLRRVIEQSFSDGQLSHELIHNLPDIYRALKIDNYSIMNTGSDGSISPISKVLQEVIGLVRANGLGHLFTGLEELSDEGDSK